jgi:hypothetical protein
LQVLMVSYCSGDQERAHGAAVVEAVSTLPSMYDSPAPVRMASIPGTGFVAAATNAAPASIVALGSLRGPDLLVLPDVGDDGTVRPAKSSWVDDDD